MSNERELLERWSGGDETAAEAMLELCLDPLARFFSGKVNGPIDDLVQETLLRCLARRASLAPGSSFRAYMFTVARHLLYEQFRRAARHGSFDPEQTSIADLGTSPSSALNRDQEKRLMQAALRELPVQSQLILELFYWEELSVSDLAVTLEIPAGTVKSRLHRARGQLREKLGAIGRTDAALPGTLEQLTRWDDSTS